MKTGCLRLNLKAFAKQFLGFLVATQSHKDPPNGCTEVGAERV